MSVFASLKDLPARVAQSGRQLRRAQSLAGTALVTAVSVVIRTLTINVGQFLKIGFSFLGLTVCGFLYGPVMAGISGVLLDIMGYVLAPSGPYFPGFTFNEFVAGFLYGCWLYKRPVKLWRCAAACASVMLLINLLLTPLWLQLLYGNAVLLSTVRLVKNLVQLPVNTALVYALLKLAEKYRPA